MSRKNYLTRQIMANRPLVSKGTIHASTIQTASGQYKIKLPPSKPLVVQQQQQPQAVIATQPMAAGQSVVLINTPTIHVPENTDGSLPGTNPITNINMIPMRL